MDNTKPHTKAKLATKTNPPKGPHKGFQSEPNEQHPTKQEGKPETEQTTFTKHNHKHFRIEKLPEIEKKKQQNKKNKPIIKKHGMKDETATNRHQADAKDHHVRKKRKNHNIKDKLMPTSIVYTKSSENLPTRMAQADHDDNQIDYDLSCATSFVNYPTVRKPQEIIHALSWKVVFKVGKSVPIPKFHIGDFPGKNRFHLDTMTNRVNVLYRPWMKEVLERWSSVAMLNRAQKAPILIGPQGVGKSHFLYLFAAYMKSQDNFRVLYLPNCSDLFLQEILVDELKVSFYDPEALKLIFDFERRCDKYLSKGKMESKYFTMLESLFRLLYRVYHKMQIIPVMVFDQYNTIDNENIMELKCMHTLSKLFPLFCSCSSNNNVKINETQFFVIENMRNYEVHPTEVWAFCKLIEKQISLTDAKKVHRVAGEIPLELITCCKQEGATYEIKIDRYNQVRYREFFKAAHDYLKQNVSIKNGKESTNTFYVEVMQNLRNLLVGIFPRTLSYDRTLIRETNEGDCRFINNLAWLATVDVLVTHHADIFNCYVGGTTIDIIGSNGSEREVVRYVIMNSIAKGRFKIGQFIDVLISGPDAIQRISTDSTLFTDCVFFVPIQSNFPGFDLIVHDSTKKEIYLVKITIEKNCDTHRNNVMAMLNNNNHELTKFLKTLASTFSRHTFYEVYLTNTEACIISEDGGNTGYNDLPLSILFHDYPSLKAF
ncbi:hypothetical protein ROZALSC1DRAFT_27191 [Rozella allomycis CSF55]|uniref:Uncharacterized protein n=1 Tax=Rozella allomycis (strain CSF55) TaxID=988480 RepID=A0A075ARX3_ROZAC|nr:hypothetical protein O9G_003844 [Rozella allomycis CSF55]RKP21409.1 hypothetical protein ROZALSC1DRAFT_27191 [Rozella allomycis CSF55]|eukprot:EPZ33021.1 hypothetical protein O9G_003844 [Rozella allomycis CSF55]